jgi:hypothetical protein
VRDRPNVRIHIAIGALLLCLGCTSLVSAQRVERESIVNAVKIKLSTDRPIVSGNDSVVIKFTITNTSKVELPVAGGFDWIVRREDDKPITDTGEGARRKEARRAAQSMNVPLYLAPGASSNQVETLSKLYVMSEPGVYQVSLWIGVTDEMKTDFIKSNMLRIIIK